MKDESLLYGDLAEKVGLPGKNSELAFLALAYLLDAFAKQFVQAECTLPPDFHISLPQENGLLVQTWCYWTQSVPNKPVITVIRVAHLWCKSKNI